MKDLKLTEVYISEGKKLVETLIKYEFVLVLMPGKIRLWWALHY